MPTEEIKHIDVEKMLAELEKFNDMAVDVGYFDGETATIALYNDFGTRRIPSRPFMRATADDEEDRVSEIMIRGAEAVVHGKKTALRVYAEAGARVTSETKKAITSWSIPPNAPSTIKAKGVNNPLIDTGHMRRATTFKIRSRNGGSEGSGEGA
jgi:hypothetical protein